jgi:hypothetical protein
MVDNTLYLVRQTGKGNEGKITIHAKDLSFKLPELSTMNVEDFF